MTVRIDETENGRGCLREALRAILRAYGCKPNARPTYEQSGIADYQCTVSCSVCGQRAEAVADREDIRITGPDGLALGVCRG